MLRDLNFFSPFVASAYMNNIARIFKYFFVKSIYFIPQTATVLSFRTPVPETSILLKFGFKLVNHENM